MAAMMFKSNMALRGAQRPAVAKSSTSRPVVVRAARETWYPGVQTVQELQAHQLQSRQQQAA
jgi:hypothetical protein